MIARGTAEAKTGHQQQAYQDLGYLKLVHGISLHGVLVLPAAGLGPDPDLLAGGEADAGRAMAASAYGLAIAAALIYDLATL